MNMFKLRNAILVAAIAGSLAACGGGGGAGAGFGGLVVNSYISGATVTLDTGNDGCATASAYPSVPTDAKGAYTFPAGTPTTFGVCAMGGTNTATNQPFTGVLTSPPNATVTTPLTTLVVAQMKNAGVTKDVAEAAVAAKLGLAQTPGILTATDPVAAIKTNTNTKLEPINAAVQVLMQKASESVASAAGVTQSATISKAQVDAAKQDIYRSAAKSLGTALLASGTIDLTTASVSTITTLAQTAIASTVTDLKTTTPANLKTALGGSNASVVALAPTSVAALAATGVATLAQAVSTATTLTTIATQATTAQTNLSVANVIADLNSLLTTTASAASAGLTNIATSLFTTANLAAGTATPITTANITNALSAQASNLGVSASAVAAASAVVAAAPSLTAPANYLQISDQVSFNGTPFSLTTFKNPGVTVTAPPAGSLDTVAFTFSAVGNPLPSTATRVGLGLQLCDAADCSTGRVLQIVINEVDMSLSGGAITATVPAGATLTAYGKTTAGTTATLTLTNVGANVITSANNMVNFNAGAALDRLITAAGSANTTFSNIRNAKGTFFATLALSGVPLYDGVSASLLPGASVTVTGKAVVASGQGVTGKVTVQ